MRAEEDHLRTWGTCLGAVLAEKVSRQVVGYNDSERPPLSSSRQLGRMMAFVSGVLLTFLLCTLVTGIPVNAVNGSLDVADLEMSNAVCVESQDWIRPDLLPKHCVAAGIRFFREETAKHGTKPFEFVAPGAPPLVPARSQSTPRKYKYRKS